MDIHNVYIMALSCFVNAFVNADLTVQAAAPQVIIQVIWINDMFKHDLPL